MITKAILRHQLHHLNDKPQLAEHLNLLFQNTLEGNLSFITWGANNKIAGYTPDLDLRDWDKLEAEGGIQSIFFNYIGGGMKLNGISK